MITESKVIELFCMADVFASFFDVMVSKYTLKPQSVIRPHTFLYILYIHVFSHLFVFYRSLIVGFFAGIAGYVKKNTTKICSI